MSNLEEKIKEIIRDALYRGQSAQRWYRPDIFKVDEDVVNKTTARVLAAVKEERKVDQAPVL